MEWNKLNSKNNKIELSLSALMFFSPLIKSNLKDRNDISNEDKNFIRWFIRLWYLNIVLLIITIIFWIIYYKTTVSIFDTLCNITLIMLVIFLWIWSVYAIAEKPILKKNSPENGIWKDKLSLILNYIPLYNVYLWYNTHDFESTNIELKESLILWWLFSIISLLPIHTYIHVWFLIIILLFIVSRTVWLDFWEKYNNTIDKLFKKNPEELWWYIVWLLITPFNQLELNENIDTQKWKYSLIFKLDHKHILLEYIILLIISLWWLYRSIKNQNYMILIGIVLILGRYWLMIIKRKHVPHIPVLKELTHLFFRKKAQTWNTLWK